MLGVHKRMESYKMGRADASHFEPHADRWHGKKEWENPVDNHYGYDMVAL
jgi:hypothetical protein